MWGGFGAGGSGEGVRDSWGPERLTLLRNGRGLGMTSVASDSHSSRTRAWGQDAKMEITARSFISCQRDKETHSPTRSTDQARALCRHCRYTESKHSPPCPHWGLIEWGKRDLNLGVSQGTQETDQDWGSGGGCSDLSEIKLGRSPGTVDPYTRTETDNYSVAKHANE